MAARELQIEDVSEFKKNYSPSLGEAVSAWSGAAMYGEGTAYFNVLATQAPEGAELDEEQWKTSPYYRDGMEFEKGLAENQWANNAKLFDERQNRNFILSKTSTAQDIAGFFSAFAVGVVEPQNAAVGVGVGMGIGALAKSGYRAFSLLEKAAKAKGVIAQASLGAAEGVVATAITEPLNLYAADKAGSDYDIADSAWNLLTSTAFGAGLRGGGQAYVNHMNAKHIQMRQKEIIAAAAEDGRAVAPEQVEAFVASEQKRDLTLERDTYIKQREETVAKLSEAEQANVRLYDEVELLEQQKLSIPEPVASPIAVTALPKNLQGAKPRYGYKDSNFTLKFESDVDRALYITSQTKKSAKDEDYRDFLRDKVGLTDKEINKLGKGVREKIKENAKARYEKGEKGEITLQTIVKERPVEPRDTSDIDKRIAEVKSKITSPDIISHLRASIKEVDDILAAFPKDEELLPAAKELVNTMLGDEQPEMYNQFLTTEDAARLGDEQRLLIDKIDEYQETGQLDEADIAQAENEIDVQARALKAAELCLTGS